MSGRDLVRFIVLSVDPILHSVRASAKKRGHDRKLKLAECTVVRESDFGINDTQYVCTTHLGHILKEGDVVMG
jgi:nonsense-mediated mRNA decay protein 3